MEEKKLTDEAVNATAKSLKWVCNQIPNDLGNSNEEKMLKCIQLYCQQGIAVIERLQSENKELKSPKFASWKLKFFNLKEEFDKELSEHEEFTKKAKAEIERLTEEKKTLVWLNQSLKKQVDELEDKIEQGTLIELPCKVGDIVWVVCGDISQYKITEFWYDGVFFNFRGENNEYVEEHKRFRFFDERIGKTVFLTREEAEKKSKELQNGN